MSESLPDNLRPSRKSRSTGLVAVLVVVFIAGSFSILQINPFLFFTEFHYVLNLAGTMFPPTFELLLRSSLWESMGETVAMAFLGTMTGGFLAFIFCFFAATNTAPHPVVKLTMRFLLSLQRVAPDYAIMAIILLVVGFGPFAGSLALTLGSTGMFGKFFADAVEAVERRGVEGIRVLGASKAQEIRYGIVPVVLPNFVANLFFLFEINMAGAIALGAFGGGGLGFHLQLTYDTLRYDDMFAYILFIVSLMVLIERGSDFLRKRLIRTGATLQ